MIKLEHTHVSALQSCARPGAGIDFEWFTEIPRVKDFKGERVGLADKMGLVCRQNGF